MSDNTVATPIVDKNGKQTTVHKKAYKSPSNRVANVVPTLSFETNQPFSEKDERIKERFEEHTVGVDHPWTQKYRVPVIKGLHPRMNFVATLAAPAQDTGGNDHYGEAHLEASDDEAALIGSFIQYKLSIFREGFLASLRKHPIDLDDGVNTISFAKTDRGWIYSKATWDMQPHSPYADSPVQYPNLIDLMDKIENWTDKPKESWVSWKTENGLI